MNKWLHFDNGNYQALINIDTITQITVNKKVPTNGDSAHPHDEIKIYTVSGGSAPSMAIDIDKPEITDKMIDYINAKLGLSKDEL